MRRSYVIYLFLGIYTCMFRNSHQYLRTRNSRRGIRLHPYGNIIISTIQANRSIVLTTCRYKSSNLNSRNYYDLLGVEQTATQKEIKKAFFTLSKEYHPDSNAADKSLHEKFVKINEAFSILSKQSTRTTYNQTLDSASRPGYQSSPRQYSSSPRQQSTGSPFDWSNSHFNSRGANQRRSTTNESDWGTPHFDKTFFDVLRRRMAQDRQRPFNQSPSTGMINNYIAPFAIISFLIGFGFLIHVLQWRMAKYNDPNFAADPRSRNYYAYREWQRLSSLKEAQSMPMRDRSIRRDDET